MRTGIIFRNSPKTGAGTARHRTHGRRRDAGPFSRFIFDPTQSAFKKFGNSGSSDFSSGNTFRITEKALGVFHIPCPGIHFVTKFQNRNTLSTAEGSLPAAVFCGGRARPAYRLYPALFSTHQKFAKIPRQFPCRGIRCFVVSLPYLWQQIGHRPVTGLVGLKSSLILRECRGICPPPCTYPTHLEILKPLRNRCLNQGGSLQGMGLLVVSFHLLFQMIFQRGFQRADGIQQIPISHTAVLGFDLGRLHIDQLLLH